MSAAHEANTGPHRPGQGRRRAHRPTSLEGLPTAADLAQQTPEQAERFPLYTSQQIEFATRAVRLDIDFRDPIHIRDQAEMIVAAMQQVIFVTRHHRKLGAVGQRVDARKEAAACARALNIFNGKQKAK